MCAYRINAISISTTWSISSHSSLNANHGAEPFPKYSFELCRTGHSRIFFLRTPTPQLVSRGYNLQACICYHPHSRKVPCFDLGIALIRIDLLLANRLLGHTHPSLSTKAKVHKTCMAPLVLALMSHVLAGKGEGSKQELDNKPQNAGDPAASSDEEVGVQPCSAEHTNQV